MHPHTRNQKGINDIPLKTQVLPRDFDVRRTEHYQALREPLDPAMFIDALQSEMRNELGALNDAMPLDGLEIRPRPGNQGSV